MRLLVLLDDVFEGGVPCFAGFAADELAAISDLLDFLDVMSLPKSDVRRSRIDNSRFEAVFFVRTDRRSAMLRSHGGKKPVRHLSVARWSANSMSTNLRHASQLLRRSNNWVGSDKRLRDASIFLLDKEDLLCPSPKRGAMKSISLVCAASLLAGSIAACSVYMEATRPTPVDLNEYQEGMTRDAVLEKLGAPDSRATESDGTSCDFYKLYTRGYGAGGKIPIAVAEGAADFFTLGLAEVVLTPTEGVTKNEKHPVTFCYNGQKLVRITGEGQPNVAADQNPPITAASSATSGVRPSATAVPSPSTEPTATPGRVPTPSATPQPSPHITEQSSDEN